MKILHEFDYTRPATLDEAFAIKAEHGAGACPLVGGTDVMVVLKHRNVLQLVAGAGTADARWEAARRVPPVFAPEMIVNLQDIDELKGLVIEDGAARVGPACTMVELCAPAALPVELGALADAAGIMGSPLIRNRATVGGNIVNARPAADTAIAMLAIGADLVLGSAKGERRVPIEQFFTGPGRTVMRGDELLVSIEITRAAMRGTAYLRQGTRRQLEIALTSAAASVTLDEAGEKVTDARIALGAVGPTPVLAAAAAQALIGQRANDEAIALAAAAARAEAKPIDDFRGSAAFRLELVEALVRRVLALAVERAGGQGGQA